jgi:hypothetical protein
MNRKGFTPLIVIGIIAAIVVIGAIGYFAWRHSTTSEPATQISQSTSTNQSTGTGTTLLSPTIPSGTVIFSVNVGQFQISLSAKDQQQSTASGFCGANDGAVEYTGDYHLISKNGSTTISNVDIGQTFFTANLPHDGLQEFTAANGNKLLGIYEYKGCSNEAVEFFKVSGNGIISPVNFMNKDGSITQTETTGPDGSIPTDANGDWVFCGYDNAIGFNLCDSFAYTGINFSQVDSWAGGVFPVGQFVGPQSADEARRALIDYISNLDKKDCANGASSNTCLLYDSIEDVTSTLPNTFLFSVDFYQGIGISTNGTPVQFSVQKMASGFNVIRSIPPTSATTSQSRVVTLDRPSGNSLTIQRGATLTVQWQTSGGASTDYVNFDIAPASSTLPHTENPDVRDEGTHASDQSISFPVTVPPGTYILSASFSDNCNAAENCDDTELNPPITLIVTGPPQTLSIGSSSVSVLSSGIFAADNSCAPQVLVVANDQFGFHMEGLNVVLQSSRIADSIVAENSSTDLDGNAVFDVTSNQAGTSTLTAWINGIEIGTTTINFVNPANQSCSIYQEG